MTINEFQDLCMRTRNDKLNAEQQMTNALIGLAGETGECLDIWKKHLYQGHYLNHLHLASELGDVAWYLALSANTLGFKLEDIFTMVLTKLQLRYPENFSEELSAHRKENDI